MEKILDKNIIRKQKFEKSRIYNRKEIKAFLKEDKLSSEFLLKAKKLIAELNCNNK